MLAWATDDSSLARKSDSRRLELEERPDCKFVGRDEFVRLLTSTKNLIRDDEGLVGLKGLLDLQSKCRFLIDETELYGGESSSPRFQG